MTAEEAAYLVPDGSTVAFGGFSPAGAAKTMKGTGSESPCPSSSG
jgi:acyl CoA:acetate/3-ketoacid CoA transferase alpha subunit